MALQVKDTSFRMHSKSITFETPTRDAAVLFERASALYKQHFDTLEVRLIGVTLEKLGTMAHETVQMSLWNYGQYEEMDQTKLLIADLNRRLEKPALMRGSQAKKKGGGGRG